MIIYGSRGRSIHGQHLEGMNCPNCGNQQLRSFGVLRYFHIYWIPMFPTSKIAGVECLHCNLTFTDKELPKEIGKEMKATLFTPRKMVPMFAGLILLAFVFAGGYLAAQADNRQETALIQSPMANDIYLVDFTKIFEGADPTYKYGVMKINEINGSDVALMVGRMGYDQMSGPRQDIRNNKANSREYYSDEFLTISIEELRRMKSTAAIYSIERR